MGATAQRHVNRDVIEGWGRPWVVSCEEYTLKVICTMDTTWLAVRSVLERTGAYVWYSRAPVSEMYIVHVQCICITRHRFAAAPSSAEWYQIGTLLLPRWKNSQNRENRRKNVPFYPPCKYLWMRINTLTASRCIIVLIRDSDHIRFIYSNTKADENILFACKW